LSQPKVTRVLIVQDHPLLASAIARILNSETDLRVSGIARGGGEAAAMATREKPSVVLIDFRLPDTTGPAAAADIKLAVPSAAIVFHSADETESSLLDAIDAGAVAYLTKSATADQIDDEARRKMSARFTPRELEVLRLLAGGDDTATLASHLGIAPHTVEWHVRHVIEKLGVHSKLQAVIAAARIGLIEI
jgi:DNA-binding NarL/FixJ family response regulator